MTVCNYDGDYRFVDGSPLLVGKGVTDITDPYTGSIGFDNSNVNYIDNLPSGSANAGIAVSFWCNLNKNNEFGFASGLEGDLTDDTTILNTETAGSTSATSWEIKLGGIETSLGGGYGVPNTGVLSTCSTLTSYTITSTVDTYLDLLNMGWFHVLAAAKITNPSSPNTYIKHIVYVNDTLVWDAVESGTSTFTGFQIVSGNAIGELGAVIGQFGANNAFVLSEFWLKNSFVNWSKEANRYKFHKYENGLYKAEDLGARGLKPGLGTPIWYLAGGPTAFLQNRAPGGGTGVLTGGGTLTSVSSDPF